MRMFGFGTQLLARRSRHCRVHFQIPTGTDARAARCLSLYDDPEIRCRRCGGPELSIPSSAVADAQAAIRMVRKSATDWNIVPHRVGFLGFSVGPIAGIKTVVNADAETMPVLMAAIYPAMGRVAVTQNAPPLFAAIAADDPLWRSREFGLVQGWLEAGRSAKLHCYRDGGHGFGMGTPQTTSAWWLDSIDRWMRSLG